MLLVQWIEEVAESRKKEFKKSKDVDSLMETVNLHLHQMLDRTCKNTSRASVNVTIAKCVYEASS